VFENIETFEENWCLFSRSYYKNVEAFFITEETYTISSQFAESEMRAILKKYVEVLENAKR
jgi:hypothetical protein